jgi:hypothetical protein
MDNSEQRGTTEQQDWGHDAQLRSGQGTPEINLSQATDVQAGSESESDPNHSSREQSPVDVMSGREAETNHNQQTDLPSDGERDNTVTGLDGDNELGRRQSGQDRSDSNHIDVSSTPNRLKRSSSEPTPWAKRPMLGERDFTSRDLEREERGRSR